MSIADKVQYVYIPRLQEELRIITETVEAGRADLDELKTKMETVIKNLKTIAKDPQALELKGAELMDYYEEANDIRKDFSEKVLQPPPAESTPEEAEEAA